ncbi:MAG: HIT domain-containing protein [Myxococcales bacterium]|nr:HIT domain-containing protein [Myxococcales bacterium]
MSVFLKIPAEHHVASNALAFAVRDAFPVTEGHTLIITRRVVPTWFDATAGNGRGCCRTRLGS